MPTYAVYDYENVCDPSEDIKRPVRIVTPDELASMTADELRVMVRDAWPDAFFYRNKRGSVSVAEQGLNFTYIEAESEAEAAEAYAAKLAARESLYAA
jgi:hypothetical protein